MYCAKCGKQLIDTAVICPDCGHPTELYELERHKATSKLEVKLQDEPIRVKLEETKSPRSRATAMILCIFLGFAGAHRFYTGKVGTGVIYLFLCTLWVVRFIDLQLDIFKSVWSVSSFFMLPVLVIVDLVMIITGSFCDNYGRRLSN